MKFVRKKGEKKLIETFVNEFEKIARDKERSKQRLSFVLTGGNSPKRLYKKLSKAKVNWDNVDFFWGDERFVPKRSPYSNFYLVKNNLFKFIQINKNQIHSISTENINLKKAVKLYGKKIRKYFKKKIIFDIFLLGMGDDGHIASIFKYDLHKNSNKIVRSVTRKDFKRITINLKIINKSKLICLWLNTRKKTEIFYRLKNQKSRILPVDFLQKKKTKIYCIS